jgi:fluoroacetyl-CoA thioesterase
MKTIPLGAKGTFTLEVKPEHLASRFKDATLPPVFSTPVMIMVMENAALNAIKAYLEPGESAVGTRVDVKHLAATPVGMHVTGEAEVTHVDGRRLEFTVRAHDDNEPIGEGTHERMIVDVARLAKRLAAKAPG